MERGLVEYFNGDKGKQFGFIRTGSDQQLFFHFNDGRKLNFVDGPAFIEDTKALEFPHKGDLVYFERKEGRRGEKASPWGFEYELRQSKRAVGIRLLTACPDLVEKFSCLPALFADAKRPEDMGQFTVSQKPITSNIWGCSGRDHYPSGSRIFYFALTKGEGGVWIYKMFDYSRFTTWRPDGIGRDYCSASCQRTQLDGWGSPWASPVAIVQVDTSVKEYCGSSSDYNPQYSRQRVEKGKQFHHTATIYLV